jgi:hypothetical protein
MRARLGRWIAVLLVAMVGTSTLSALSVHSRCIAAHHACDSTPSVVDCCCAHVGGGDTQSAVTTSGNPPATVSPVAALPQVHGARDGLTLGGVGTCSRLGRLLDRVTLFGALLI